MPGVTISTFSNASLRELLVERYLPLAKLVPSFGMANELIICLVRRVVGRFAIFMRNLSCLIVTNLSMGSRLSLVLKMFSIEMW